MLKCKKAITYFKYKGGGNEFELYAAWFLFYVKLCIFQLITLSLF